MKDTEKPFTCEHHLLPHCGWYWFSKGYTRHGQGCSCATDFLSQLPQSNLSAPERAKTLLYLLSLSVTWTRWLLRTHYDRKAVFLLTLFSIPAPGNRHSRSIPRHGVRTSHSLICQHQVKNRPVRVLEIEQPFGTHNLADSINTIFQHSLKKCCAEGCYHKTKQKKSQTCG